MNDSNKHAQEDNPRLDPKVSSSHIGDVQSLYRLQQELERVIIKLNYHFQSGYERHVTLQSPESIFLNFLKKEIKEIPQSYMYRICKKDFTLLMRAGFVENVTFHPFSTKHDWRLLDDRLKMLSEVCLLLDFDDLKKRSATLEKFYQVTCGAINDIKNFKFK